MDDLLVPHQSLPGQRLDLGAHAQRLPICSRCFQDVFVASECHALGVEVVVYKAERATGEQVGRCIDIPGVFSSPGE